MTGFLAEVPAFQQRRRSLGEIIHRQRAAVEQDHDGRLVERENCPGEVVLLADQIEAVAVAKVRVGPAFAAGLLVISEHHYDDVGSLCGLDCGRNQLAIDGGGRELDLVARPTMPLGDPHAFRIVDRELALALLLHRFEQANDVARLVTVAADRRVPGMRAEHRHAVDLRGVERQQAPIVLEQDDGFACRLSGQRDRVWCRGPRLGRASVDKGMLEQPGFELHLQDPAHGRIDLRLRHAT